jgi:CBS domain containing-hemolysin-like protein
MHKALFVYDRLSLTDVLAQFQQRREDVALIVNEHSRWWRHEPRFKRRPRGP